MNLGYGEMALYTMILPGSCRVCIHVTVSTVISLLADDWVPGEEADWHQQNGSSYQLDDRALPLLRSVFDEHSEVLLVVFPAVLPDSSSRPT